MRKLYLLLFLTFFSCSENKLSINKETILKYNMVSEYGDIADTLNVYFEKSFETKLNVSNLKKNKSIVFSLNLTARAGWRVYLWRSSDTLF